MKVEYGIQQKLKYVHLFDSFRIQTLQNVNGVVIFYGVKRVANMSLIPGQADYGPNEPITQGEKMVGKIQCLGLLQPRLKDPAKKKSAQVRTSYSTSRNGGK